MTLPSHGKFKRLPGFTIVELLIVIVIITILAGLVIVGYIGITARARAAEVSAGVSQSQKKLELYKVDNGGYPLSGNLAAAGVANGAISYQYTSSDGTVYCITGTEGSTAYNASNTTSPASGVCTGHAAPSGGGSTTYAIGDTGPGGGKVFYDAGSTQSWGRYLEAAPGGWNSGGSDPAAVWGCYGATIPGADGLGIGTGKQNTTDILASCTETGIAARLAASYTGGGKTDWYLPSRDELNQLYLKIGIVSGLTINNNWSSSEYSGANAWVQQFSGGNQYNYVKGGPLYVHPIRAF